MTSFHRVEQFHLTFGHPVAEKPGLISMDRAALRLELINEELNELREAILDSDMVEIADALADLTYVICGCALEYGIPLNECVEEVHRSNMTKLGEDGMPIYREDGKILKGPGYEEPDIKKVLEKVCK